MTSEITLRINPDVLRNARARLSMSRDELSSRVAKRIGSPVGTDTIGEWESGAPLPSVAAAEALAEACLINYLDLFRSELPADRLMDFRSPPDGAAPRLSRQTRERLGIFSRLYDLRRRLSAELDSVEDVHLPAFEQSTIESDLTAVATALREALSVTRAVQNSWSGDEEALADWRSRTEALGVSVFSIALDVGDLRGASLWELGGPPAVMLNSSDLPSAQSFTLMHELGHLMTLGGSGGRLCDPYEAAARSTEIVMNDLAGEVLVPSEWLREETRDAPIGLTYYEWPQSERVRLRDTFNVSNQVLGIRLKNVGRVTDSGYRRPFWRMPSTFTRGTRRPRWSNFRRYMGEQTVASLRQAIDSEAVTTAEVARLLRLKASEVDQIVGPRD